jgi:hypothetical protein
MTPATRQQVAREGGRAAAEAMTAAQRQKRARTAARARWSKPATAKARLTALATQAADLEAELNRFRIYWTTQTQDRTQAHVTHLIAQLAHAVTQITHAVTETARRLQVIEERGWPVPTESLKVLDEAGQMLSAFRARVTGTADEPSKTAPTPASRKKRKPL